MPNTKISALTAGDPAQGTDEIPIARGAANFKVTAASIAALSPAGTVTSVGGTGTVNGITLTGTVTSSGSLTLGGALSGVSLTTQVSGTLPTANGGTNLTTFTSGGAVYATSTSALTTGTLPATAGGTGNASYAVGDIVYASTTTALSRLADVATGNALISGGVGVAPSYGKIGLTTHVSGTLPTANGGTNLTTFTSGGAVYATSTSALTTGTLPLASGGTGQTTKAAAFNALSPVTTTGDLIIGNGTNSNTRLAIGTNGYVLTSNGTTASWQAGGGGGGGVTSFDGGFTGLTPATATTGAVSLGGTLSVSNGGTGLSTTSYGDLLYGNASATTYNTLSIGSFGQVLVSNGSNPYWTALSASDINNGTLGVNYGGTGTSSSPSNGQLLIGNGSGYSVANLTAGANVTITNSSGGITIAASGGGGGGSTISQMNISTTSGSFSNNVPSSTYSKPLIGSTTVVPSDYGAFFFKTSGGGYSASTGSMNSMSITDSAGAMTFYSSGTDFDSLLGSFYVQDDVLACYGLNIYNAALQTLFSDSSAAITSPSLKPLDAQSGFTFTNPQVYVFTSASSYNNQNGLKGAVVSKSGSTYILEFGSNSNVFDNTNPATSMYFTINNSSTATFTNPADFNPSYTENSALGRFKVEMTVSNATLQTLLDNSFLS